MARGDHTKSLVVFVNGSMMKRNYNVRRRYAHLVKRAIFILYALIVLLSGMLIGAFGAVGVCVRIWGPRILETALGSPPDRSHPAFWLGLLLLGPSMLIGAVGSIALFVLPVAFRFPSETAMNRPDERIYLRFMRRYAESMLSYVSSEEQRLSSQPDDSHDKTRNV